MASLFFFVVCFFHKIIKEQKQRLVPITMFHLQNTYDTLEQNHLRYNAALCRKTYCCSSILLVHIAANRPAPPNIYQQTWSKPCLRHIFHKRRPPRGTRKRFVSPSSPPKKNKKNDKARHMFDHVMIGSCSLVRKHNTSVSVKHPQDPKQPLLNLHASNRPTQLTAWANSAAFIY